MWPKLLDDAMLFPACCIGIIVVSREGQNGVVAGARAWLLPVASKRPAPDLAATKECARPGSIILWAFLAWTFARIILAWFLASSLSCIVLRACAVRFQMVSSASADKVRSFCRSILAQ
jgi:hypothetical protein